MLAAAAEKNLREVTLRAEGPAPQAKSCRTGQWALGHSPKAITLRMKGARHPKLRAADPKGTSYTWPVLNFHLIRAEEPWASTDW